MLLDKLNSADEELARSHSSGDFHLGYVSLCGVWDLKGTEKEAVLLVTQLINSHCAGPF